MPFLQSLIFIAFLTCGFLPSLGFAQAQNQDSGVVEKDLDSPPIIGKSKILDNKMAGRNSAAAPATQNARGASAASSVNSAMTSTNSLVKSLLGLDKVASLMFSDEEMSNIDRAVESFKNNQSFSVDGEEDGSKKDDKKNEAEAEENKKSYIYLASIMYFSNKEWAIWINDDKISSDDNDYSKEMFVKDISPDGVKIIWNLTISKWKILSGKKSEDLAPKINGRGNVEIVFSLKPNQTYILSSGRVVEGRAVATNSLNNSASSSSNNKEKAVKQ